MTRSELIEKLAEKNPHLSLHDAERVVSTFFNKVGSTLVAGDRVELRGFGSFSVKKRDKRVGRNPRNGDRVMVEEKHAPAFKIGKGLLQKMNEGKK